MAGQHGGYRQPAHPAVVSGPGAHSRRTDGNFQTISTVPGQDYGEAKQQAAAQRLAPMAGKEPLPTPTPVSRPEAQQQASDFQMPQYSGGDFGAPSARPNEHISTGAPFGDTPGPEVLSQSAPSVPTGALTQMLQQMSATDTTGLIGKLYQMAAQRGV